jgi:hypothetical protein
MAASANVIHFREHDAGIRVAESDGFATAELRSSELDRRAKLRAKLLQSNPIFWLAHCGATSPFATWGLVLLVFAGLGVWTAVPHLMRMGPSALWIGWSILPFLILVNVLFKVFIAGQSCRCMAEARRNSTLEILLCAPLSVDNILQGQILALRRSFLWPALALLAFELLAIFLVFQDAAGPAGLTAKHGEQLNALMLTEGLFIAYFLVDLQAVAWAGMWFGLCSRNESLAAFKTVLYVMLLPFVSLVLSCLGMAIFAAWPVVALVWSRLKLQEQFRSLAGKRATSSAPETSGWIPFEVPDLSREEQPAPL